MKTIFFEDSYIAGFEVTTANDVIKAQELGLHICDKNQNYFDDIVVEIDEDGIETERVATKEECMERMFKALKEQNQLYATFNYEDSGMKAVKDSATILASDFRIGQTVYTMLNNKIAIGTILYISMSIGEKKTNSIWIIVHSILSKMSTPSAQKELVSLKTCYCCLRKSLTTFLLWYTNPYTAIP